MNGLKIECNKCIYFYITWDKNFPKGCKAYGFKAKELPSIAVYNSSLIKCMMFREKSKKSNV